jgi:hypothetical protein
VEIEWYKDDVVGESKEEGVEERKGYKLPDLGFWK